MFAKLQYCIYTYCQILFDLRKKILTLFIQQVQCLKLKDVLKLFNWKDVGTLKDPLCF